VKTTATRRNGMLDSLTSSLSSGLLSIYSGTRPTDADTALSGNTLLVSLTLGATAAPASSGGVLTMNTVTSGTAVATGTASFARQYQSNGTTAIADLSLATSGSEVTINTTSIVSGATVSCSSYTITNPVGT
jgi:hypothetical protein